MRNPRMSLLWYIQTDGLFEKKEIEGLHNHLFHMLLLYGLILHKFLQGFHPSFKILHCFLSSLALCVGLMWYVSLLEAFFKTGQVNVCYSISLKLLPTKGLVVSNDFSPLPSIKLTQLFPVYLFFNYISTFLINLPGPKIVITFSGQGW